MEQTIPGLFLKRVEKYRDRVALREKNFGVWDEITWETYYEHVSDFAYGLISLGFKEEDCLAILSENRQEWLYADVATQCLGAVRTGIYPTEPSFQVKYLLKHSKSKICVVEDQEQTDKVLEFKDEIPELKWVVYIDPKGLRNYNDKILISFVEVQELGKKLKYKSPKLLKQCVEKVRSDDVAIMVYTSGTTGPPKGAMLSHRGILQASRSLNKQLKLCENDDIVSYLPLCHAAECIFSLFIPMLAGNRVNFAESVSTVQEALIEISPSFYFGVPRIWEKMHGKIHNQMLDSSKLKQIFFKLGVKIGEKIAQKIWDSEPLNLRWKALRLFAYLVCFRPIRDKLGLLDSRINISGSAPIGPDILRFFHSIGVFIQEGYGMTENSGITFLQPEGYFHVGSVGFPIEGVEYKILEDGELIVRSDTNFVGYYRDPEATAKCLVDGWVYTGDVVQKDKKGNMFIVDRKKDIIITAGGKNISPSEIEHQLKSSFYIKEAIIVGDRRKFVSALIEIDYDITGKWATKKGIPYTNYKNLAGNPEVHELIVKEVEKTNKVFARVQNIRKFQILPKELDVDDSEVTATQKVRRKNIQDYFSDLIEEMYQ